MNASLIAACLAVLLVGPAVAQGPAAPPPAAAAKTATIDADPAIWIVRDADTSIYLFGTVHLLDPRYRWFDGTVKAAFDRAGELVVETLPPPDAEAQATVMRLAIDPDGPPLTQKLTPDTARRFAAQLQANGLPANALEKFEPWFAAMTLSAMQYRALGMEAQAGVDPALIAAARKAGKKVVPLEGFAEQLAFFDTLPEADQLRFLEIGIDQMADAPDLIGRLMSAWAAGDDVRLADVMNEGMEDLPGLRKLLLDDRNARWADWIKARLDRPGTVFVAVGAGHLAGRNSVRALLQARGLAAARVD